MKYLWLIVVCLFPLTVSAQSDWQEVLRDWMTAEDVEEAYSEDAMEFLANLAEQKINLNQTSREELESLPFLSSQQVEEIVAYIDRYHPLRTLNELMMIKSLEWNTRRLLLCFVEIGDEAPQRQRLDWSKMLKEGKQQVMTTVKIPLYQRKGDRQGYAGYPYRHDIRYQFNSRDRLKFGLTAAQDAGEPFFANKNKLGYDHYSYYFQLRNTGRLEELNVGMYRVQMGMGLVMNTAFYLGKLASLSSLGRSSHVLTAYSSRSASTFLRGAAATVRLSDHWKVTAFASYRPVDATLNSNGSVRTIVSDGYHRTEAELAKKDNTHELDLGFRLSWKPSLKKLSDSTATARKGMPFLNLNAVFTHFDRRIVPYTSSSSQLYRRDALSGNDFLNVSLDYGYTNHRFSFSGETAMNRSGALAALHMLRYRLSEEWTAMVLHRYYEQRYTAFHARSFSEGSSVQNEHGLYTGLAWSPSRSLQLQGYVDYAHFPGPRYLVSTTSDAVDALLFARVLYKRYTLEGRYRFHLRQRDNDTKTLLRNRYEHRGRLFLSFPLARLTLQTQADGVLFHTQTGNSRGVMVSQQASWQYRMLRVSANIGWFHTDDYDSRIYQYDPSVLYDFSFPVNYGHGIRYSVLARADVGRWMLAAKLGVLNYFDRAVISSGLQQIDASSQPDILLQARLKF